MLHVLTFLMPETAYDVSMIMYILKKNMIFQILQLHTD